MITIGYDAQPKAIKYSSAITTVLDELRRRPNINLIPFIPQDNNTKFDLLISCALSEYCKYPMPVSYLPHGLSPWKGTRFQKKIGHYFCCSSYEAGRYFNTSVSTYDVVGWPKLDFLVQNINNQKIFRNKLIQTFNLDSSKPIIAYLPTYTYTGETRLLDKNAVVISRHALNRRGTLRRMTEPGFPLDNLILAPHFIDMNHESTQSIIRNYDKVFVAPNKNPLLLGCDVILGDISSILIESLVVNKPIVHLTNGHKDMFIAYKDNHSNKYPREHCILGAYTHKVEDLSRLIKEAATLDPYKEQRQSWRNKFIYLPPETATVATANAIEQLARKNKC